MIMNPTGLIEFINSPFNPDGFLEGIGQGLSTNAGVTAMWAHMVAGDIFVTKWIWKKCIESKTNIWIMRFSIFFGVMLMPIGLAAYVIFGSKNKN